MYPQTPSVEAISARVSLKRTTRPSATRISRRVLSKKLMTKVILPAIEYDAHMMFIHFPPYLVIACYSPGFRHVLSQFQLVSIHFWGRLKWQSLPACTLATNILNMQFVCIIYIYWLRTHRYRYIHIHYVYVCKLFFSTYMHLCMYMRTWIENKSSNSWCQSPS